MIDMAANRKCATCAAPVHYPPNGIHGWQHVEPGIGAGHLADPVSRCRHCGAEGLSISSYDAWANYVTCGACGDRDRYSIGD